MKRLSIIAISFIILIAIAIYSFGRFNAHRILEKLYTERRYLLKEFCDKTILNRGNRFYQLSYNKGPLVNTFFFEKKDSVIIFTNESLQYPIAEIPVPFSFNPRDTLTYRNALGNELSRLLKVMDHFKITNVSTDFKKFGIDAKIYLEDYRALLYIRNVDSVKNEQWKNYIKFSKKLDENWYLVKDK